MAQDAAQRPDQLKGFVVANVNVTRLVEAGEKQSESRIDLMLLDDAAPTAEQALYSSVAGLEATASSVSDLALSRKGDQITLRISDNGIGITEQQLKAKDSFGLISMKERALSMGGIFAISSEPGKGTVINLIVPVTVKAVPFRAND